MTTEIEYNKTGDVVPEQVDQRQRRRRGPFGRFRRRLRRVRWTLVFIIIFIVIVVLAGSTLVLVTDGLNRLNKSEDSLDRVLTSLNNRPADEWTYADYERLQTSIKEVVLNLQLIKSRTSYVKPIVSRVNTRGDNLLKAVEVAEQLGLAVDRMLTGAQPAAFFVTEGQDDASVAQVSSGERIVERLQLGRSQFVEANAHLDRAEQKLAAIDRRTLSEDMLLDVQTLENYLTDIRDANELLIQSPQLLTQLLGIEETQTYLILSQNNDELRPAGGYISTWGWMTVRNGRILEFEYNPTTTTEPNPPPASFAQDFDVPSWWYQYERPIYMAWDGSWYVDFGQTAEMAAWYYNNGDNPGAPVDGVIAIDITGLEYLLEALGEVELPGYAENVGSANFRNVVYEIRASRDGDDLAHKNFLADLYSEVLVNWQNVPQENKSDVLGAILRGLREKHVMLYFADDSMNQALDILDWDGRLDAGTEHDYILVADANLSANKSNNSIFRQWTYDVEINQDGTLNSRLIVNYDYPDAIAKSDPAVSPEHYWSIDYFNRVQIHVPAGSDLVEFENFVEPFSEIDQESHTIFVSSVLVYYNSGERVEVAYQTPALIETVGVYRRYRLRMQKQPGTRSDSVNIQVRLPSGAQLVSTSPSPIAEFTLDQPIVEFRVDLLRDQWVEIIYKP